jgi:hypothetical protein
MDTEPPPIDDALGILRGLTADQILARLDQIRAEEAQLRVLLKTVRARDRAAARLGGPTHAA